ncbi:Atxe2 family lasso peptide isopeptidase [Luteimonas sp. BDR2-5]|uniref:Atxe2 family lasso peptide isopeptidase n=1 Tax=Proluteimonas luteida TaxID=2878685 RepID=UPI001E3DB676|nr:Atxe2 family lasso peptide isopeptidase [Luteimonas sp. BDR2-5]MCD9026779.1 Atxe2 family lasso peptide isopeptidase [Luteimonas sp. BDR2-5]
MHFARWTATSTEFKSFAAIGKGFLWTLVAVASMGLASEAHAQTISPRRLLEVVDLGNPAISPDGRMVAFRAEQPSIERNTYDTVWYVQGIDGASLPLRVAEGGAPLRGYESGSVLPAPAIWSPDGRWIYYRAHLHGRISVWRANADGSGAMEVTVDPADVRDFALSGEGRTLKYSVGATREEILAAEKAEYDQGVRIDEQVITSAGLVRSSLVEGRPSTQRFVGSGWYPIGPLLGGVPDRWKAVDLEHMTIRELPLQEVPSDPFRVSDLPQAFSESWKLALNRDDGRVAILTRVGEGEGLAQPTGVELAVLPSARSNHLVRCVSALCTKSNSRITDVQWRPGTDDVLFTAVDYNKGRAQSIFGWNVSTGDVRLVIESDGLVSGSRRYWDIPCGASQSALVCIVAEADRPPRVEAVDLSTGERRILFDPNKRLEVDIAATVPSELIRWTDERGREFTGHLFEAGAAGEGPPPLFVHFYSCYGFLRGGLGDEWPLASLAELGISALCINAIPEYRLDSAERYDQARTAVESVVAYLSAGGRIDPTRVGMGGLSYGNEVTMWTAAHSDVLATASVGSPTVTPLSYVFGSLREGFRAGLESMWGLGPLEETPNRWKEMSPVFHLDAIQIPILFQMVEQEYQLSFDYAFPLFRRHQADIYAFPDEAHIKFQPRHKLAVYERNIDWFRFWLQGYEDSDPLKIGQYRVWRQMQVEMERRRSKVAGRDDT